MCLRPGGPKVGSPTRAMAQSTRSASPLRASMCASTRGRWNTGLKPDRRWIRRMEARLVVTKIRACSSWSSRRVRCWRGARPKRSSDLRRRVAWTRGDLRSGRDSPGLDRDLSLLGLCAAQRAGGRSRGAAARTSKILDAAVLQIVQGLQSAFLKRIVDSGDRDSAQAATRLNDFIDFWRQSAALGLARRQVFRAFSH